jgi:hypothetical protein
MHVTIDYKILCNVKSSHITRWCNQMAINKPKRGLEEVAAHVMESLVDLIRVMQDTADHVSRGLALEDAPVCDYQIYLLKEKNEEGQSHAKAIVSPMDYEDYIHLLEKTAAELGIYIGESTELKVNLPEAEFGEDLVSGGFENFKGVTVEVCNDYLERLMETVCRLLEAKGLAMARSSNEDVILYLPLSRSCIEQA